MTSLWRICISVALLAAPVAAATLSGRVELRDSREASVRKKRDFSGVVVWLDPVNKRALPKPAPAHSRMAQKDKTFIPHVLAITAGATVDFPNFDPIFHNAFSNYDGQTFDIGLYPPGTSRSIRFARVGIVRVFCNIHAHMSAVIAVLDSVWFTVTGPDGVFEIQGAPAGEYRLRVFHERATEATLDRLSRTVTLGAGPLALPAIGISESGYLPIPHTNKYGHQYPPPPDEAGTYPAVRK